MLRLKLLLGCWAVSVAVAGCFFHSPMNSISNENDRTTTSTDLKIRISFANGCCANSTELQNNILVSVSFENVSSTSSATIMLPHFARQKVMTRLWPFIRFVANGVMVEGYGYLPVAPKDVVLAPGERVSYLVNLPIEWLQQLEKPFNVKALYMPFVEHGKLEGPVLRWELASNTLQIQ